MLSNVLGANNIEDAGAKGIGEAIKSSTTLSNLEINNGKIGVSGAVSIAEALKSNTKLTKLFISKLIKR